MTPKQKKLTRDEEIAYEYEAKVDDIVLDYFNERGCTITRRDGLDEVDYNLTHNGNEIILEVKTRDAYSTDYPTAYLRIDKVNSMEKKSTTENKPAWLMYVFKYDGKFFFETLENLKTYPLEDKHVYNPIKQRDYETNVVIPLEGKKWYDLETNTKKSIFT